MSARTVLVSGFYELDLDFLLFAGYYGYEIMKKIFYILLFSVFVLFSTQDLFADAGARYSEALKFAKQKKPDFALMEFRSIIRDYPKSKYAQKAIFAIAEYSYDNKIYQDALTNFIGYINNYNDPKAVIFAKAYLIKIMEEVRNPTTEEEEMFDNIKKDFFSKSPFLIFSEYKKTSSYRSAFQNRFKIKYYKDNIEVYRNGQLFIKIYQ